MTKVLTGDAIRSRAVRVCESTGPIYLAVAYWGQGALEALFPGRVKGQVHVVLNVAHGGTNPSTLDALMKRFPDRVRVNDALHAKIYASQSGAVVGSANASAGGLGLGAAGHAEAAVWLEGKAAGAALVLAKTFYEAGRQAAEADVAVCRKVFGTRTIAAAEQHQAAADENAFETFLRRRDWFGPRPFILTSKTISQKVVEDDYRKQQKENTELDRTYSAKKWYGFDWHLLEAYRGTPCVHLRRDQKGNISMALVMPTHANNGKLHFARRLKWSEIDGLGRHWHGKIRRFGSCAELSGVVRRLIDVDHVVTGWDICDALKPDPMP